MGFWQSVRFRIVFGFILIIAPLVLFLFYNNLYAMDVVRGQISSHYNKLLMANVRENDKILEEYKRYLIRLERNSDIPLLQSLAPLDSDYNLAKIRLNNQFVLDSGGIYYSMDTLFIYIRGNDDLFFATSDNTNNSEKQAILLKWGRENLMSSKLPDPALNETSRWSSVELDGMNYLLSTYDLGLNVYAGVLVRTPSLLRVLENFAVGPEGGAFLMNEKGELLADSPSPLIQSRDFRGKIAAMQTAYGEIRQDGKSYLVLSEPSAKADVSYVIVMPESSLLQNLPSFQKILYYWIPLMVAVLLSFYLIFLQRIIFRPLVRLIRGMRKLGQGRLDVRLPDTSGGNTEFAFLSRTFNQMAEQIERLKIDVYEEQLRVQRAEYKHLQIQINPHFYMNSLNIIYNLAALKDYKTVQKLSLHLADYFRFLMQSNRTVVTLEEEIKHIGHYLEIQKLRYVNKLDYELDIDPKHRSFAIAPLMIQPFVENSVIHGFNKRPQDGTLFRIRIAAREDEAEPGRFVALTIEDNGSGFPQTMLEELESGRYVSEGGDRHLGIWNILRRFKMLYGDAGGIRFYNVTGGGAGVEVRLPTEVPLRLDAE
ncbi:histidine kinase [Cohnella fermenti]|nr:histidine kinase [Cohnella fermenti]